MKYETKFELGTQVEVLDTRISGRCVAWYIAEGSQPRVQLEWTDNTGKSQDAWFLESRVTAAPPSAL